MSPASETLLDKRTRWREDPVAFCVEVLGVDGIWPGMVEMLEAVRDHKETAVAGCHDSTKTFTAACLALWWVSCFYPAKVITTAPGGRQVSGVLWTVIRELYNNARIPIGGVMAPKAPEWYLDESCFMLGFSTKEDAGSAGATRFQGFKSPNLLVILDEAVAIEAGIWMALSGIATKDHCRVVAMANPTDPASEFAKCWRKTSGWHTINISAFDTPNLLAGEIVHPYTPTPAHIERVRGKYGEGSPAWDARVLGRFPSTTVDTLISLADISAACQRDPVGGELSIGVDVARFGDDLTTIYVVRGDEVIFVEEYQGRDTVFTAGRTIEVAREHDLEQYRAHMISVDDTGLGGGVTDHLRACGWSINPENFGSKAKDEETYANRRSELWAGMRDWLRDVAALSGLTQDQRRNLEADLPGTKYEYRPDSRIILEPKKSMKKRLGHSPDHGDALALALAWRSSPPAISIEPEVSVGARDRRWGFGLRGAR